MAEKRKRQRGCPANSAETRADRPLDLVARLGRRSTIVGLPPSAVPNFSKSLIVVARRGFRYTTFNRFAGLGTLHALRTLVFHSRTAWLRRFQGPGTFVGSFADWAANA